MGVRRNFSRKGQSRHFAYIFQVANADDQVRKQAGKPGNSPPKNSPTKNITRLRLYDDEMQMPDVNKTLYAFYKTHRCRSRQFFGCAKYALSEFRKFTRETFMRQTFLLQTLCSYWQCWDSNFLSAGSITKVIFSSRFCYKMSYFSANELTIFN